MVEALEHFERPARDPQLALHGLPGVGVGAEHHRPGHVARLRQLRLQPLRQVGLEEQPRFEIEARREADIGVGGPGVAIDTAVLAAPVGVERAVEAEVGAFVEGQRRFARLADQLRRRPRRLRHVAVEGAPAVVERLGQPAFVAHGGVGGGAPALAGAGGEGRPGEGLGHAPNVAQAAPQVKNKIRT